MVQDLIELLKGETTLLYGQPMVGKTLSTVILAKTLKETEKKPALLIWSDANLLGSYGEYLKKISGAEVKYIDNPYVLEKFLRESKKEAEKYSMFVIDSLTGFQESIMAKEGIDSPRTNLLLSRLSLMMARHLREISANHNIPTVMIAHQTAVFAQDPSTMGIFAGKNKKPSIVSKALRNVTLLIYQYIENEKPVWLVEDIRSSFEKVAKFPKGTILELNIKIK